MASISCPRCKKTYATPPAFCRRCGMALASAQPPAATASFVAPTGLRVGQVSRSSRRRGLLAFCILIALSAMVPLIAIFRVNRSFSSGIAAPVVIDRTQSFVPELPDDSPRTRAVRKTMPASAPSIRSLPVWQQHIPEDLPTRTALSRDADFRGQLLTQVRMDSKSLVGTVFAGAECLQATFEKSDLSGADFRGADLTQASFAGAILNDARFDEARIHQTVFIGVDSSKFAGKTRLRDGIVEPIPPPPLLARGLGKASFANARISQVTLDGLSLAGANFSGASLQGVSFRKADLRRVDFRSSIHFSTDFAEAQLDGADFRGADLYSAQNLTYDQLAKTRTDAKTRRPQRRF